MNRSQALAIFANMDQGKLLEALSAVGVQTSNGSGGGGVDGGNAGSQKLESWNARDVALPRAKRPQFLNTDNLIVKMPELQRGKEAFRGQEDPGGYEQYMPTRPDVFG